MGHRLLPFLTLLATAVLLGPSPLWSHGGGLDKYGCHHKRLHGGYHCHRGRFNCGMFASKAEMLQGLEGLSQTPRQPEQTQPAIVQEFTGRVVDVSDGDAITVLHSGKAERTRLHGIDCPEKRQAFGKRGKQATSALVFGKTVTVRNLGQDCYGRTEGEVILPDGRSLNHELVKAGFAWWYRRYAPEDQTLKRLDHEARQAKRGLWVGPKPVPPWEWRGKRKRYR